MSSKMRLKKKAILLDIEGTTTSISFVKDVLFPYVKNNLESYLNKNWNTDEMKLNIKLLAEQADHDIANNIPGVVPVKETESEKTLKQNIISNVLWQMSQDRKTKALKTLQGHIWLDGYNDGQLVGHIYPDVYPCLMRWKEAGLKLYIYSSGSVAAQKLLFGHTEHGDLIHLFSGFFDTGVGTKVESSSYRNILNEISCDPDQVAFLTDIVKEAEAAHGSGITPILLVRDGPLSSSSQFTQVSSFDQINVEQS
uniref:Enolase-phosphatase E1 n=1 Tax=Cacopsylla melanoneura TaxID=428564 RepID=A0A8D8LPY7_9HEMI